MLGWSVHGLYAGIEDAFITDEAQHPAAVVLLAAVITTIIASSS